MNNYYIPKPWHFVVPIITWALATWAALSSDWVTLGWILYALGIVETFVIVWASVWDVFVRKADAMRNLYDSVRGLDDEIVDRILYAMGLRVQARIQSTALTIKVNDHQTRKTNVPASPDQLAAFAHGVLIERASPSRREWVDRRAVFSDAAWRKFAEYLEREKWISLRDASKPNAGFAITETGERELSGLLPSPTPPEEVTINP